MMRRRFIALLTATVAALAGTGLVALPAQAAGTVVPDAAFADCLNTNYLNQAATAPITAAQLQGLTDDVSCSYDGTGSIVSIQGAEELTGITGLYLDSETISDLTLLSGLTNLRSLSISYNQISDLTPLAGLTNLSTLALTSNQISDITPLAGLANLTDLDLGSNQISDLTPLSGLSNLTALHLANNEISDLTPLSSLSHLTYLTLDGNQVSNLTPLSGLTANLVNLSIASNQVSDLAPLANLTSLAVLGLYNNHVTDLSPLAGLSNIIAWDQTLIVGCQTGSPSCKLLSAQTASMTITSGTATALPVVSIPSVGNVTWTVASGAATVNPDGTVTMANPGTATLTWTDANGWFTGTLTVTAVPPVAPPVLVSSVTVAPASSAVLVGATTTVKATIAPADAANSAVTWSSSDASIATVDANGVVTGVKAGTVTITATAADGSGKSGTATITVTTPAPVPSAPDSTVAKDGSTATTTGGAARLADGKDSYTITVKANDADGKLVSGVAGQLAVTTAKGVTVSKITDNKDGTYTFTVASATPGNYLVTVTLNGTAVGDPVPVNFIAATDPPKQVVGNVQTADGLGFLPGEKVAVTVHSTTLNLGTFTADQTGKVHVSFTVPAAFADATHKVTFAGVTSGTVTASFTVPAQTLVPAGGTPAPENPAAAFAFASFLTLAGGALVRRLRTAR